MNLPLELPDEDMYELVERVTANVMQRLQSWVGKSEYITPVEAAELLRCERQRIYDLCSDGRLERYREGSRTLLRRDDVVSLVLLDRRRSGR